MEDQMKRSISIIILQFYECGSLFFKGLVKNLQENLFQSKLEYFFLYFYKGPFHSVERPKISYSYTVYIGTFWLIPTFITQEPLNNPASFCSNPAVIHNM